MGRATSLREEEPSAMSTNTRTLRADLDDDVQHPEITVEGAPAGRALIYLRVSSSQQADKDYDPEGFSIPAQREACIRKADSIGALVVEEFIDRGESAKTANRAGLQALLKRVSEKDITHVVVHKVDRLARNRADDVDIVMRIRAAGAQLV